MDNKVAVFFGKKGRVCASSPVGKMDNRWGHEMEYLCVVVFVVVVSALIPVVVGMGAEVEIEAEGSEGGPGALNGKVLC
jgi:hypothetical protein